MSLCRCVAALSEHHHTGLPVLGLGGTVLHKFTVSFGQMVFLKSDDPCTCSREIVQREAAYHIVNGELLGQTVEGIDGLLPALDVH